MWAIIHKKTRKWVYAVDYRHPHNKSNGDFSYEQFTSHDQALTFATWSQAKFYFVVNHVSDRYYAIVPVKLTIDEDNLSWLLCEELLMSTK